MRLTVAAALIATASCGPAERRAPASPDTTDSTGARQVSGQVSGKVPRAYLVYGAHHPPLDVRLELPDGYAAAPCEACIAGVVFESPASRVSFRVRYWPATVGPTPPRLDHDLTGVTRGEVDGAPWIAGTLAGESAMRYLRPTPVRPQERTVLNVDAWVVCEARAPAGAEHDIESLARTCASLQVRVRAEAAAAEAM